VVPLFFERCRGTPNLVDRRYVRLDAIEKTLAPIGLIFQRISLVHKRSKTILFSDKAVVRRVKGVPYLMVRIGELRSHQLIEATVSTYCIRHERHAVVDHDTSLPPSASSVAQEGIIEENL
jgi:hypothetical protein